MGIPHLEDHRVRFACARLRIQQRPLHSPPHPVRSDHAIDALNEGLCAIEIHGV